MNLLRMLCIDIQALMWENEKMAEKLFKYEAVLKYIAEESFCDGEGVLENHKDCPEIAKEALDDCKDTTK